MLKNCKYYWESMYLPLDDHVVFLEEECEMCFCVRKGESRCVSFIFLSLALSWDTADKYDDQNEQNKPAEYGNIGYMVIWSQGQESPVYEDVFCCKPRECRCKTSHEHHVDKICHMVTREPCVWGCSLLNTVDKIGHMVKWSQGHERALCVWVFSAANIPIANHEVWTPWCQNWSHGQMVTRSREPCVWECSLLQASQSPIVDSASTCTLHSWAALA